MVKHVLEWWRKVSNRTFFLWGHKERKMEAKGDGAESGGGIDLQGGDGSWGGADVRNAGSGKRDLLVTEIS